MGDLDLRCHGVDGNIAHHLLVDFTGYAPVVLFGRVPVRRDENYAPVLELLVQGSTTVGWGSGRER